MTPLKKRTEFKLKRKKSATINQKKKPTLRLQKTHNFEDPDS